MEPKKILFNLVLTTGVIYALAISNLIPGLFIGSFYSAIVVAGLMGLLNIAARMSIVSMNVPVRLLTFWISTLILNTAILIFINYFMDHDQFTTGGYTGAFLGAFVISVAQSLMHKIFS